MPSVANQSRYLDRLDAHESMTLLTMCFSLSRNAVSEGSILLCTLRAFYTFLTEPSAKRAISMDLGQ